MGGCPPSRAAPAKFGLRQNKKKPAKEGQWEILSVYKSI